MPHILSPLEYVDCDLCGSKSHKLLYRKQSKFRNLTFSICRCNECALTFTNPRIPESLAREVYSEDYYKGEGVDSHFKGETKQKEGDAHALIRCIEHITGKSHLRLLDAGGGAGLVTAAAQARGHEAHFTDLSAAAVRQASEKGLIAHLGKPESLLNRFAGHFDVVVALEVIEHVYSPKQFLKAASDLLVPGGLFVFTTGNVGEARWQRESWGYFDIPEGHLYYFGTITMNRYLSEAGLNERLSPYYYFFKQWWAVRLLQRLGAVQLPEDFIARTKFQRLFIWIAFHIEKVLGRERYAWAKKPTTRC